MGNLPCCNPEEPHKPTAFSSSSNKNSSNQGFYSTSGIDGKSSSFQNNASNLSSSNALQDATTTSDTNHILSEQHSTALDDANKIAMEERQRALLQEKERLQRIVNDASLNMVHVNGSNMRGMNAYYDPGYAADVWEDLIPGGGTGGGGSTNSSSGRSSSGGLIAKCGQIVPIQVHSVLKLPTMSTSTSSSTRSMEKRLSKPFTLNGVVDREHVLTLKEWLVSHPKSGSYNESSIDVTGTTSVVSTTTTTSTTTAKTTTTTTNMTTPSTSSPTETTGGSSEERIELLLDDLTERFMAIILAQQSGRQFDGVDPIVENVL